MKTTTRQDKDFAGRLFDDVDTYELTKTLKELFSRDSSWVLDWVTETFDPGEVYDEDKLGAWAESNGYTKETK